MIFKRKHCIFGSHLTIDGYKGSQTKLNDKELVLNCLNELPELLDMHKLSEPEIYFAEPNDIKDCGGWSGFVVIMESHISIHTFPKRGFVTIDVYTCKGSIDKKYVIDYFKKVFELKEVETNYIVRGKKYPLTDIY